MLFCGSIQRRDKKVIMYLSTKWCHFRLYASCSSLILITFCCLHLRSDWTPQLLTFLPPHGGVSVGEATTETGSHGQLVWTGVQTVCSHQTDLRTWLPTRNWRVKPLFPHHCFFLFVPIAVSSILLHFPVFTEVHMFVCACAMCVRLYCLCVFTNTSSISLVAPPLSWLAGGTGTAMCDQTNRKLMWE